MATFVAVALSLTAAFPVVVATVAVLDVVENLHVRAESERSLSAKPVEEAAKGEQGQAKAGRHTPFTSTRRHTKPGKNQALLKKLGAHEKNLNRFNLAFKTLNLAFLGFF